ncbi:MinD/ParA family protein [Bacillaceae bacterium SIJ1]|uniref:P-loop NTPase n=1 Tax=Litoribacterium kuwaitense TaxID=1398745 RepID=UPI0013EAEF9B|nr:P-loop NTPase [Litoribacterium kuwaitense]NGP44108.1 MinD/ParA family protein [Litoribacterium kuwaitense]
MSVKDQADRLRQLVVDDREEVSAENHYRSVCVISGKGGVGKTSLSVNLALALAISGQRVLVVDMDIGMGNVEAVIGVYAKATMADVLNGQDPRYCVQQTPFSVDFIAGGNALLNVDQKKEQMNEALQAMERLFSSYHYVLFDLGAGVSDRFVPIVTSVDELIGVTIPEPPALTDLYGALKWVHYQDPLIPLKLVVNKAATKKKGYRQPNEFQKLQNVSCIQTFII